MEVQIQSFTKNLMKHDTEHNENKFWVSKQDLSVLKSVYKICEFT